MVLYHAITAYQLLNCIVHRIKYHPKEKAVLLLPDFIINKYKHYKEIQGKKLFDEVFLLSYAIQYDALTIEKKITEIYEETIPYSIEDFSEIYVGGVHFPFTIYLILRNIPFHYFEEASGLLSRPEVVRRNVEEGFPRHAIVAEKYNLFELDSELVKSKIGNFSTQKIGYHDSKAVNFEVMNEFLCIEKEIQNDIMDFFGCPRKISIENADAAIILTQHFTNLKILDFEQQVLIYQLFADYFLPDTKLIFKTHPDDCIYYDYIFEGACVIRERFPSEFLPFIFDIQPRTLATISSTAIKNISSYFVNKIYLGVPFEQNFYIVHSYYIALRCFQSVFSHINLYTYNCQEEVIDMLIKNSLPTSNILIEDCLSEAVNALFFDLNNVRGIAHVEEIITILDNLQDKQVACFCNCKYDYGFYDIFRKDIWEYMVPVIIHKNVKEGTNYYSDNADEVVYFYTKNSEVRSMLEAFEEDKNLKYSGIGLKVKQLSKEEQQMQVLKGILDATEKRLLYYIQRERELQEYINENDLNHNNMK